MKRQFGHLLPLSDEEIDTIWNNGVLTVDANVLLDLYRYHPETREALVRALREFQGRLWLSHQAATEFVRNRARAASAVGKELADAVRDLCALEVATKKATDDLRGRRPLPREVGQRLKAEVDTAIRIARTTIEEVHARCADGASRDAVLDDVLSLFDGCVYQTATFVERAVGPLHGWLAALVLDDIRREDLEDVTAAAEIELDEIMMGLVGRLATELIETNAAIQHCVTQAEENEWRVDDVQVTSVDLVDNAFARLRFTALVHYASVPAEEPAPMLAGSKIRAQLRGTLSLKNGSWSISEHEVEDAEIECDGSEHSDDEEPCPSGPVRRTTR